MRRKIREMTKKNVGLMRDVIDDEERMRDDGLAQHVYETHGRRKRSK